MIKNRYIRFDWAAKYMLRRSAEGAEEAKRENARRMKADGMYVELISKCTGLTIEAIASL